MKCPLDLEDLLGESQVREPGGLEIFAVIALGVVESLISGVMSADDSLRDFFNAENCIFVEKRLKNKVASEIMGRGVQLTDLFDMLERDEAHREYQLELQALRTLSLKLLQSKRRAA